MNLNLTGKRAIVCGSTQGIGKAAAIELASLGASITLIARNEEKLKQVMAELPQKPEQVHNYITTEELRACTTCNACVEECPVGISPLDIILKQRRYLILDESNSPGEWNAMFGNIENNFAPWKFNPGERDAWINS